MKVYELQFIHENGTVFEKSHFTDQKTALDSMAVMREHYMEKYRINPMNVENYGQSTDEMFIVELDNHTLSLVTFNIKEQVIKYV